MVVASRYRWPLALWCLTFWCLAPVWGPGCAADDAPPGDAALSDAPPPDLARPDGRAVPDLGPPPDTRPSPDARPRPDAPPPPDLGPPRPDGPSNLGAPCTADHQCSAGLTCVTSLPGGMCTRTCGNDTQCGAAGLAVCHDSLCRPLCDVRLLVDPCRTDYTCRLDGARAVCVPRCQKVACKAGHQCDASSGLCVDPKGGTVGAPCGVGIGDCSGTPNGICFAMSSSYKPFCTVACAPFAKPCPFSVSGAGCLAGSASGAFCVFSCDPKKPVCPHKDLVCVTVSKDRNLCVPK